MAHYAYLDENNIVTQVIVGKDENEDGIDWEKYYGAVRTSYNTYGGIHKNGGEPFRKNYASIGFFYDEQKDAFIPPKPFPSWILNEYSCLWEAPISMPQDNLVWQWNEEMGDWENISIGEIELIDPDDE